MTNSEYVRMAEDEGREVADATVLAEAMAPRICDRALQELWYGGGRGRGRARVSGDRLPALQQPREAREAA